MKRAILTLLSTVIFIACAAIVGTRTGRAANFVSAQSGNWSATSTWVGGIAPGAGDNVTIAAGHTVTMDGDFSCTALTINAGGVLSMNFGLTTTGNVTVNGAISGAGNPFQFNGVATFTNNGSVTNNNVQFNPTSATAQAVAGAGAWNVGNITISTNSTTTMQNAITFTVSNVMNILGTLNLNGNPLTFNGNTLQVAGTPPGTLAVGASTINFNGASFFNSGSVTGTGLFKAQPTSGNLFVIAGGTFNLALETISGTTTAQGTIGGTITVNTGTELKATDFILAALTTTTVNTGATLSGNNAGARFEFKGAATLTNNGSITVANLFFFPASPLAQTITGNGTWSGTGTLLVSSTSTLTMSNAMTFAYGTFQTQGAGTFNTGGNTLTLNGNTVANSGILAIGAGTVNFNGSAFNNNNTITGTGLIRLQPTGGTVAFFQGGAFMPALEIVNGITTVSTFGTGVNGTITVDSGAEMKMAAGDGLRGNGNVNINTGATLSGTDANSFFVLNGAALVNDGSITVANFRFREPGGGVFSQTLSGAGSFSNNTATIRGGDTLTLTSNHQMSAVVIDGSFGGATFDITNRMLGLSGPGTPVTNDGAFITTGSTIVYNGTAAQDARTINNDWSYTSLTIDNAAGVSLGTAETIPGTLTLTKGVFTIAGNLTMGNGATISRSNGSLSTAPTFGASVNVVYAQTSPVINIVTGPEIPIATTVLNNLSISNSGGVTLNANTTLKGTLTLAGGNLDAGSNTLSLTSGATISRTTGHVLGNLKKTFSSTGAFIYTVGTANGFSPADVTVTAGTGDLTVKAVQGPQPILDASKSLQRYWTLSGSGITADLTFHYLDVDVMGNESIYRLIRVTGGTAAIFPASPPTVNPANNTAFTTGVSSFSDWTAGQPTPPTAVELVSFAANGYDRGTLLQWQTGSEVDNLGFNLYREESGKRVPVNAQLVAGSALVAGSGVAISAGQTYAIWDSSIADCGSPNAECRNAQYWLEEINLNGQSTWHGPYTSRRVGGAAPARSDSSMLSRLGNAQSQPALTRQVEQAALTQSMKLEQIKLESGLANQPAVKMWVKREGLYKVTASELAQAGLDPKANVALLQLYADGVQIPINVIADKDGSLALVEFYARGLDAAFTDHRVYWLVSGSEAGLRIKQAKGSGYPTAEQSFLYTAERKDRTIYFSGLRNGERENFFGAVIGASPLDQTLTIQHVDQSTGRAATLEVALQGVTTLPHRVWVYLNDTFAGESFFEGQANSVARFTIAESLLREGDNQIRLVARAGSSDISLVDYIRLSYWHSFTADDNALRFTATGGEQVSIGGFTSGAIRVLDVTDSDSVQELAAKVEQQKSGYVVTVASPDAGKRRLLAIADSQASKPAKTAANQVSSLRQPANGADVLIITQREFFSAIGPLKSLRQSQGLSVAIADIEDIYDEFSFGNKSPQSVKDFCAYAATSWKKKPRFVLFAGDASHDPKNYLGLGDFDLVPSKLVDTQYMETASDDWLADFDNDGVAELAVGRLPFRNEVEALTMIGKIISYERGSRSEEVLLVADANDGYDFEQASEQMRQFVPRGMRATEINRGRVDAETAKKALLDGINRRQLIVNYTGHGSVNLWRGSLLVNEDAAQMTNEHLTVFVMMTCLNGYFDDPALDSLAESLVKAERGAVAVWASSGMTLPGEQAAMNRELYRLMFDASNSRLTIGEATRRAKSLVVDADIRRTWILIGDPAMRLR